MIYLNFRFIISAAKIIKAHSLSFAAFMNIRLIFTPNKIRFGNLLPGLFSLSFLFCPGFSPISFSQLFTGKVLSKSDESPIPYATIGVKGKNAGTVADLSGRFRMSFPRFVKRNDSIVISSIGFVSLKLPVASVINSEVFILEEEAKVLEPVSVISFMKKRSISSLRGESSFFRGWYSHKTGGEIGNIISIPHQGYKINKIFFKVDNMYDTCHIRLHIRKVENSWPSSELLTEDIIIPIYKRSMIDGTSVFDLSKQNLVLSEKTLFIGFEVIDCSNSTKPPTSISFVGTDNGEYIFKSFSSSSWEKQNNFSIYFELGLQY